jgi:type VI secretion system protein ImpC
MPKESLQKKVGRVRPPRVQITYDVQVGDAIEKRDLPFVVGVLADLSGMPEKPLPAIAKRKFVAIDRDNVNDVMKKIGPRLAFKVPNRLSEDDTKLNVELRFESMEDFQPARVAQQITPLRKLLELRNSLANLRSSLIGNEKLENLLQEMIRIKRCCVRPAPKLVFALPRRRRSKMSTEMKPANSTTESVEQSQSILDKIAEQGRIGQSPEERNTGKVWLKDLIQDVMTGQMTVSKDTDAMINTRIADLDALISRQLNEVMHAEPMQKLEGSWRGLHYFVQQTETSSSLKIKLMNISKNDLFKDLDKAVEFDQSATFKKIYEEEYGTLGGAPFGALIGDYEFSRHPQDIALLEKMSGVAATSHAPFIAAATPALFNFESFTELAAPATWKRFSKMRLT